ncbi:MAG: HD domain-containing protein [Lachnospiraceae bacterium]|nr:HD domain-containing protein [Lachnospiraceae bacterium]
MRYLKELRDGEIFSENYFCKQKQTLQTKAGKSYYSLLLQDKTGTMDGKVWELNAGIEHFEVMDYIRVEGQVVSFQGTLQLNIRRVRRLSEGEYDIDDFMPCTKKDIGAMYQELLDYIATLKDSQFKLLAESYFKEDPKFKEMFSKHSAAKTMHHNFIGGLLEHTVSVTRLCAYLADNYPILDRDLLLTAAMFHDVGKLSEISGFPENDYTDAGQLLGHIYIGADWLSKRMDKLGGFTVKRKNELLHCILSHHGELEYGSPKKPELAEALALSMADNLDAKLEGVTALLNGTEETGWLGFQKMFEANIRKTGK